ncbi:MAG TPA: L,D-transpeptidase family protein [Thermoanaerobaculia bacterium]
MVYAILLSVNLILVEKGSHTMKLLDHGRVIKKYSVSLGPDLGPKQKKGDGRTPEGRYVIDSRKAASKFHRALHVSYPNAVDRARARRMRVDPGGDIMIHGLPSGWGVLGRVHLARDWTAGCIAVTNEEIEEIWRLVPNGTIVEIRP